MTIMLVLISNCTMHFSSTAAAYSHCMLPLPLPLLEMMMMITAMEVVIIDVAHHTAPAPALSVPSCPSHCMRLLPLI